MGQLPAQLRLCVTWNAEDAGLTADSSRVVDVPQDTAEKFASCRAAASSSRLAKQTEA
jgi:hypothetical protein